MTLQWVKHILILPGAILVYIPGAILWLVAARPGAIAPAGPGQVRPGFVYLVREAVCDRRQGDSRALGSAGETGGPRPLPPCQKSHNYERAFPPWRRVAALGILAPGRMDGGLFPAQDALFPEVRGAGPGKTIRRRLSALQGQRAALDPPAATVGSRGESPCSKIS